MSAVIPGFKVVRYGPNTYFLGGELDMAAVDILTQAIASSVASGGSILLDVGNVTFIDSTGIGAIFRAADALGSRGCIFVHAPRRNVRRVLDIVGMDDIPNVHVDPCPSDTIPDEALMWETPADIAEDIAELRALGTMPE